MNGSELNLAGAQIIAPTKFEFTELQFRRVIKEVKQAVAAQGGQLPVPDPMGVLMLGVLLDRITEIADRLDKMDSANSKIAPMTQEMIKP